MQSVQAAQMRSVEKTCRPARDGIELDEIDPVEEMADVLLIKTCSHGESPKLRFQQKA